MSNPIYLDYQATTPLAPEAREAMLPWLGDKFGNPHSPHRMGREAEAAVEVARERVMAALLGPADMPDDYERTARQFGHFRPLDEGNGKLFFTSGATEAANWAIRGTWMRRREERPRVVTVATEHACVLDTCEALEREGAEVVILPVKPSGAVDLHQLKQAVDHHTALVAAMLVNNEIGHQHDIMAVGEIARSAGATLFCDAVQGFGRWMVPLNACDLVAISAHKIHGPKGIGALWVRNGHGPLPILYGGGQEGGVRSGTLSPALCAGFGAAAELCGQRYRQDSRHVGSLFRQARKALGLAWTLNGSIKDRYRGNMNIRRAGIDAARLISEVRGVAFSAGSACASGSGRPSHVLAALGLSDAEARSSIRLGFGRYTTDAELARALDMILDAADHQLNLAA